MSIKEALSSQNPRLNRIKIIARILKILLLLYLFVSGLYLPFVHKTADGLYYQVVSGVYKRILDAPIIALFIVVLGAGLFLTAIVSCYQLLTLYEKGMVFSATNVRLLRRIGYVACGYGVLGVCGPVLLVAWHGYVFGGLPLSFLWSFTALLRSPWLIGGLFVVVVSHIMDEGRKIQEEQELTV